MASVFKLGRDKNKKRAPWYFQFIDHNGRKQMRKGFTDKTLTEQAAAMAENEARMRKLGLIDPVQEQIVDKRKSAIQEHIDDYRKSLRTKGTTGKHVALVIGRIQKIIDGCDFKTLGAIDADAVECFMADVREKRKLGPRTYNH